MSGTWIWFRMIEFLLNKNIAQHEFVQCEVENDGKKGLVIQAFWQANSTTYTYRTVWAPLNFSSTHQEYANCKKTANSWMDIDQS